MMCGWRTVSRMRCSSSNRCKAVRPSAALLYALSATAWLGGYEMWASKEHAAGKEAKQAHCATSAAPRRMPLPHPPGRSCWSADMGTASHTVLRPSCATTRSALKPCRLLHVRAAALHRAVSPAPASSASGASSGMGVGASAWAALPQLQCGSPLCWPAPNWPAGLLCPRASACSWVLHLAMGSGCRPRGLVLLLLMRPCSVELPVRCRGPAGPRSGITNMLAVRANWRGGGEDRPSPAPAPLVCRDSTGSVQEPLLCCRASLLCPLLGLACGSASCSARPATHTDLGNRGVRRAPVVGGGGGRRRQRRQQGRGCTERHRWAWCFQMPGAHLERCSEGRRTAAASDAPPVPWTALQKAWAAPRSAAPAAGLAGACCEPVTAATTACTLSSRERAGAADMAARLWCVGEEERANGRVPECPVACCATAPHACRSPLNGH